MIIFEGLLIVGLLAGASYMQKECHKVEQEEADKLGYELVY